MNQVIKAKIEFTDGKIINLDLFPEVAPISVANFVELANSGFYDGLCFHRVIPNFMIQGGGFKFDKGLEQKLAPKSIKGEFRSNGVANDLSHKKGAISMARTMIKDSATSQFFICVEDTSYLDGEYAVFGMASDMESIKTAVQISKVSTGRVGAFDDVPKTAIVIKTISIAK